MTKRRTSGVQRRARASEAAMTRRAGASSARGLDMRVVALLGILAVGAVILVVVVLFGGGGAQRIGTRQVDDGGGHIANGATGGPYSSVPATSGQHWVTPANWGVYTLAAPAFESQVIHNLEHGGIVIWYQPAKLDAAGVKALTDFVNTQVQGSRFKVILSPWIGADFGHPIAVTAWNWLLYLDSADIGQVRAFIDDHYQDAPEPNGGPGPPG
jgi:hypothetical protein